MSDVSVRFPVVFGPQRDRPRSNVRIEAPADVPSPMAPRPARRCRAAPKAGDAPASVTPTPAAADAPTSRTARSLALAYAIHRKVDAGEIRDHAHAAELLGITRPNMAYVMNLLHLAADIQEALVMGDFITSERSLRPVARLLNWVQQRTTTLKA